MNGKRKKRLHDAAASPPGRYFSMAMLLAFVVLAITMPSIEWADGDGSSTPIYGSESNPYGGFYGSWDEIEDETVAYVALNSHIMINYGTHDITGLEDRLGSSGLIVYSDDYIIEGDLKTPVIIEIEGKNLVLLLSDETSGDLPTYNASTNYVWDPSVIEVCVGETIDRSFTTGANKTGTTKGTNLPEGITCSKDGSTYYLKGSPTTAGSYDYTISTNGGLTGMLYITGTIIVYNTITLDSGDVELPESDRVLYVIGTEVKDGKTLPNLTKEGFNFMGWYTEADGSGVFAGKAGANPMVFINQGENWILHAYFEVATNPIKSISFSTSSLSIKVGDTPLISATSTLQNPSADGNRKVDINILTGEGTVIEKVGTTSYTEYGGELRIKALSTGSAILQARGQDRAYESDGTEIVALMTVTVTEDAVSNSFTIVYDVVLDNVTNIPPSRTYGPANQDTYDVNVSSNIPQHPQYTFRYWTKEPGVTNPSYWYDPNDPITLEPNTNTLYAVWDEKTKFTLSFNANGGTGGPAPLVEYDTSTTQHLFSVLPGDYYNPTREGYIFGGWASSETSTTSVAQPGGSYTAHSDNVTLYAIWNTEVKKNAIILFNANGGTGGPGTVTIEDGPPYLYTISDSTTPNKSGYTFQGWSKTQNGSLDYIVGKTYEFPQGTTIVYAKWGSSQFTVTFNANGGSGGPGIINTDGSFRIPADVTPTRNGYVFAGWSEVNDAKDPNMSYALGKNQTISESLELFAIWDKIGSDTKVDYVVEYYLIGTESAIDPETVSIKSGETAKVTVTDKNPVRNGMAFLGWSDIEGSDTPVYSAGSIVYPKASNLYLYPVWKVGTNTWVLSFNHNGGSGSVPPSVSKIVTGSSYVFTFEDVRPIRSGYEFLGWDEDENATEPSVGKGQTTFTAKKSNVVLNAIWKRGSSSGFILNLDLNGGSGVSTELTGEAVGSMVFDLPMDVPKKNGFVFVGWATSEQSTKIYSRGSQYETSDKESKLIALYKPTGINNEFKLTLVYYSGTDNVLMTANSNANTCGFLLPGPGDKGFKDRAGFTFLGWSLMKGGEIIDTSTYLAESLNDTLHAVWKSNSTASPTASFKVTSDGLEVKLDATDSANAVNFLWTFGDGSTSSGKMVSHTYKEAGKYLVTLTVYSSSNFEDTKTIYVTVPENGGYGEYDIKIALGLVGVVIIGLLIARFSGVI